MPQLVLGNLNYSSWSVRAWFFFTHAGIECEATVLPLDTPEFAEKIGRWSAARRVPVLVLDDGECVRDTLAIAETAAELWPDAGAWPKDARLRRLARSACAEMHSSFSAMRGVLTCNFRRRYAAGAWRDFAGSAERVRDVEADIARVHSIWAELLGASGGPFLAGPRLCWADAFYVPVVSRFATYGIDSPTDAEAYRRHIGSLPAWATWAAAAKAEPWTIEREEY